jgi:oligopeptide transport system substrate-binding protein
MKAASSWLEGAIILALAASTTGATNANPPLQIPLNQSLVLAGGESSNPRDYDPATTHGTGDKLIYSGLVAFDPHLNLIPDLAETWTVSNDGMVYTFTLRSNATFHDGRPVTAQDVIYSWERAADPKTESDTVLTYLGDIVGIQEMYDGKTDHIRGLQALDEHRLQVRIDAPKPYFLLKLTYPTAFIVDQKNVASGADWMYRPNGTGPYKLIEWKRGQEIVYQAYKDFYLGRPGVPYVVVNIYAGIGTSLFESGDVDMAGIGLYSLDRFLDPAEPLHSQLYSSVDLCTNFVVFDTTRPPFDDIKVRQAFTEAFDRQRYIDVVMLGHALPAVGLYPPGLPGFDLSLQGLPFDPAAARQLLAKSKYGGPGGLPPIVYTDAGFGSSVNPDVAALAQMWKQYLGVIIQIENIEPNFYLDETYAGHHGQLLGGGWCADYPDPENFADVLFYSGSQQNNSGLYDASLDRLLETARVERDVNKRIQMYQQAEREIVFDAPVLFTVHSLSYMLVKPYLKGFVLTPIDVSFERYMWIDGK